MHCLEIAAMANVLAGLEASLAYMVGKHFVKSFFFSLQKPFIIKNVRRTFTGVKLKQ